MDYEKERMAGIPCIEAKCCFYNEKYEQNCQYEDRPFIEECRNYIPVTKNNMEKSEGQGTII